MKECQQAPNLNMLQHGQLVHEEYKKLMTALSNEDIECKELQQLYERIGKMLPPPVVLEKYHVYHDCGKHICLTIIEDGKRQFPNHAGVSAKQFATIFPDDGFSKQLIAMDMNFHIHKGDDLFLTCQHPLAPILYFTAWAEINANASMFGGKESESYKIKRSRLIQAGKKLLNSKG